MSAKKIIIPIILTVFLLCIAGCGGGEELMRIEGEGRTYALYGSPHAITRIDVIENGALVTSVKPEYRVNEPWLGENNENFGFRACDLNGDGLEDIVIKTVRTAGEERYLFYINKSGEYKLQDKLSGAVAPEFGEGGAVRVRSFKRIDEPTYANEPPVYELRRDTVFYGWNEHFQLQIIRVERYSYFSETDIYRVSLLLPDENGDLEPDTETWIYPDKLAEHGLEPLK